MATDIDSSLPVQQTTIGPGDGADIDVGAGVAGLGTQRVVIATDQPEVATNTSQLGGNPIDLGAGLTGVGTQRVVLANDQSEVAVNATQISGTAIDVGAGATGAGTQRVHIGNTSANPVPVSITDSVDKVNVDEYHAFLALAQDTPTTWSFTPTANFYLQKISVSSTAKLKWELQIGATGTETTRTVRFTDKGGNNDDYEYSNPLLIQTTDTIKIIVTNRDKAAADAHATIQGFNA